MKVMVIVKASQASEKGEMPSTELLTAMGNFNEELIKAGVMLDGAGLTPSHRGARVQFSGTNRTVINGPFAETKELIAGFWVWKVTSLQEAIDWVKRCPNPMAEDSEIEIRPYFEAEDFGEAFTPELREQEAAILASTMGLNAPSFLVGQELLIAGISRTYTRESRIGIPNQWEQFIPTAANIHSVNDATFYGVCWNSTDECGFDYLTGVQISEGGKLPDEYSSLKLEGQRYAVFAHSSHVSALPKTIDTILTKWVPDCGLKIGNGPFFERYTPDFNPGTGMGGMEIWIPLEA